MITGDYKYVSIYAHNSIIWTICINGKVIGNKIFETYYADLRAAAMKFHLVQTRKHFSENDSVTEIFLRTNIYGHFVSI